MAETSRPFAGAAGRGQRRQPEPERAARALPALHPDRALVLLDDLLADGQAQAGPALLARVGLLDLLEALEDRRVQLGR
jgi:hypothetical protein